MSENTKPLTSDKMLNWKPLAALVYLFICVMDFVVMPVLVHQYNKEMLSKISNLSEQNLVLEKTEVLKLQKWEPLTLQNAGLFHIAFGTIITGAAVFGEIRQRTKSSGS
ncbi:hypothetical protein RVBP17_2170 [Pseudomonas phage sp. 30-3]|uniref:Structural protein n=1 Tax=Pseudomonas phage vB_PaeM_PA5oct TaxID=2163605 RepID=A0A4Y1LUV9_9CAUD|nr:structural protein [Pseudomonas phage vB_PaeM_PA5oct]WMI31851.1 hypothetical protein GBBBJNDB_00148 [Pseudomonas phage Callisto]WPK38781.1 hypothetical protein Cassandra_0105 [Pseudomonas phage Cassandra]WPK39302.1 hypothetical protein Deiofobo_0105 [Pseudomonas phage Deifobo]WPK39814.1 hypothetical protein ETTORE_0105 [Pseudomonas phage Ettore]WPK40335.1 hypothetical protein Paride_0105 [Pseudomonas phage Paride]VOH54444.1 hypothetical protein MIJ3_00148 [Pseudomonas phage vB_PaeM_MIJ3]B